MSNLHEPETPGQVKEQQRLQRQYVRLGLCPRCADQAAYGHSLGFTVIEPPCPDCLSTIEQFDLARPNGWRKASRARLRGHFNRALGSEGAEDVSGF